MASLMDDLLDVIEQEEKHYRKLIGLSTDKKNAIIKGDIRTLEDITNEEQDVTSILKNLETKRSGVLADMADVLGQDAETLTVRKMIDLLEKQPNEQKKLSDLCDRLRHTLDEMSAVNEQNRVLLEQALEMVNFDLTLFKSLRQAPETANYDKNAYNTGELLGRTAAFRQESLAIYVGGLFPRKEGAVRGVGDGTVGERLGGISGLASGSEYSLL